MMTRVALSALAGFVLAVMTLPLVGRWDLVFVLAVAWTLFLVFANRRNRRRGDRGG